MTDKKTPKKAIQYSAVFYTDGSAAPNPGYGGWGIHGYIYNAELPIDPKGQKKNLMTMFGYKPISEVERDGLPCYRKVDEVNGFGTALKPRVDNTEMEFLALEKAIQLATEKRYDKVTLLSDSKVAINSLTDWYDIWMKNNWMNSKGEEVKVKDIVLRIKPQFDTLKAMCSDFNILHVKGHNGEKGNEQADKLAGYASYMKSLNKDYEKIQFSGEEEKIKVSYHDFFSRNRWYFIGGKHTGSGITPVMDGYHWYYVGALGHGKKDEDFGMNQPDGYMSVVVLKEPEPIIEKIQSIYNDTCKHDYSFVVAGRLDNILSPESYADIMKGEVDLICEDVMEKTLTLPNKKIIAKEYNPAHLAFSQMVKYEYPINIMRNYLGTVENTRLTLTDITSLIVEQSPGKKKDEIKYNVNPSILKNNCLRTTVDYYDKDEKKTVKLNITLTLKTDMPDKPHLQRLVRNHGDKLSFKVITHRLSDKVVGFLFLADCPDAKAVWCSSTMTSILRKDK